MKKIDELGISPWPWKRDATSANDSTGECVFNCCTWNENSIKDARLIAAAPELYECLRSAVLTIKSDICVDFEKTCIDCNENCICKTYIHALAKASGENGGGHK